MGGWEGKRAFNQILLCNVCGDVKDLMVAMIFGRRRRPRAFWWFMSPTSPSTQFQILFRFRFVCVCVCSM